MDRGYSENLYGYTVHSFYVECPDYSKKKKKTKKASVLRRAAYLVLAPAAIVADAIASMFN
ncbi:MAG: hypothetical protein ACI4QR_05625 [Eubacteriales bacterium]